MQRRDFLQNLRDGALLGGAALLTGGSLVTGTAGGAPAPAKPAAGGAKARPQKFNGKFVDYGGVAWQKHLTYYN
ncbi:MAG: hypothetical protein LBR07_06185, partial [Puniceicoccales bacterium]|nr:hypothetical protein [Puniceicoccales bacterium]